MTAGMRSASTPPPANGLTRPDIESGLAKPSALPQGEGENKDSRIILVTGASSGIGALCAARLAAAGDRVYAASRRASAPPGCIGIAMDVDRDDSVAAAVAQVLSAEGRIDALLVCAGWGLAGAAEDCTADEGLAQFQTNLFGAHRAVRAVLPAMRARGQGRIVLVSSLTARIPIPYQAFYSASKAALSNYAEALRFELVPFGIPVSCVEPGNFRTGFTDSRRRAAGWTRESAHHARSEASIAWMAQDEIKAPPPDIVAERILHVLAMPRPPGNLVVAATVLERCAALLRSLVPQRWYEAIALKLFRVS